MSEDLFAEDSEPESMFKTFNIKIEEEQVIIPKEKSLLVRDLEAYFTKQYPDGLKKFMKLLKTFFKDEDKLHQALLNVRMERTADNRKISEIQQESLIRILLEVNCLQTEVLNIVWEKLTQIASDESDLTFFKLLLRPLIYLPLVEENDLSTKLLDVMEISNYEQQLEILQAIPSVISDSQCPHVAKELCNLLYLNEDLSIAIMNCLSLLQLESEVRTKVTDKILEKLSPTTAGKTLPVFIDFILSEEKPIPSQTILKVRNSLDCLLNQPDEDTEKMLIFDRLHRLSKNSFNSWLNFLKTVSNQDHKPIDLLISFTLDYISLNKSPIEELIRKKSLGGIFTPTTIEKMFQYHFPQELFNSYFEKILKLASGLLRTVNEAVFDFASSLFISTFRHNYCKLHLQQQIVHMLIMQIETNSKSSISSVLKIFSALKKDGLERQAPILMQMLSFDITNLDNIKELYEVLCSLVCNPSSESYSSGFRDELQIMLRKQLASLKINLKLRGVLLSVLMAKYMVSSHEDQTNLSIQEQTIINIKDIPNLISREAAGLLELTRTSIKDWPELTGLYYDQLALMLITSKNLDKYFLAWLYEQVTNHFEDFYVTESVLDPIDSIHFSMQYSRNTSEEISIPLGIKIADLVYIPDDQNLIVLLAPHFKLLRLIHYIYNDKDLGAINALLGCSVVLPKVEISELSNQELKLYADCLYHCCNWFREAISGFVTQKDRILRIKVVNRLLDLIEVEGLLKKVLEIIPNHKLPQNYYNPLAESKEVKAKPKPRKRAKSVSMINESTASAIQTKSKADITISFRELDTDILLLLKYPLSLVEETTQAIRLNLDQLHFLLNDFKLKLELVLNGNFEDISYLKVVSAKDLVTDCIFILPHVHKHLLNLQSKIKERLKACDHVLDSSELYSEEMNKTKACFGLILENYKLIFSWPSLVSQNLDLLKEILSCFFPNMEKVVPFKRLIKDSLILLGGFLESCLSLQHGVSLIQAMEALSKAQPSIELQKLLAGFAKILLNRKWYNEEGKPEQGNKIKNKLNVLIKVFLESANVETICGLIGTLQDEIALLKSPGGTLNMLSCIDKSTVYILYQNLCISLVTKIKSETASATNTSHVLLWKATALSLQGLMTVSKIQDNRNTYSCFLKTSISILKYFLSHGIPVMEIILKSKTEDIISIFKTFQTSTRFSHHLCCHFQKTKDTGMLAHIPAFRSTIESTVYQVKAILIANNCSDAFWMGNLKNKDIDGEEILTQSSMSTEIETNEELPEDDTPEDMDLNGSDSEVF